MKISIYTDGSCIKSNPKDRYGNGAWAFCCIMSENFIISDSGFEHQTTNNRMELRAVIEAVKFMSSDETYIIYSDSKLTINCAIGLWSCNANLDLWSEFKNVSKGKIFTFEHVKAHNGHIYNEMVDKIAYNAALNKK